jgi:hypothetical protein
MQEITVTIDENGQPVIETRGFKGKACTDATRGLEQALGFQEGPRQHKPEYFAPVREALVHGRKPA